MSGLRLPIPQIHALRLCPVTGQRTLSQMSVAGTPPPAVALPHTHELYRILKPGGWGILLSPVEPDYEQTYEDDSITDPEERTRIFGQYDHRRIYGADYTDRLRTAGFEAADIDYAATFSEAERRLYALPKDHIYVVYKH